MNQEVPQWSASKAASRQDRDGTGVPRPLSPPGRPVRAYVDPAAHLFTWTQGAVG